MRLFPQQQTIDDVMREMEELEEKKNENMNICEGVIN